MAELEELVFKGEAKGVFNGEAQDVFKGDVQSLADIMAARDKRVHIQQTLLRTFERPLVSFKLNTPGPVKYSPALHQIFDGGVVAFRQAMAAAGHAILFEKLNYDNSGPEYFAVFDAPPKSVKALSAAVESAHSLGRLFDFDVVGLDGSQISRSDLGLPGRSCLLCSQDAFVCARERRHGLEALQGHIQNLYQHYFKGGSTC